MSVNWLCENAEMKITFLYIRSILFTRKQKEDWNAQSLLHFQCCSIVPDGGEVPQLVQQLFLLFIHAVAVPTSHHFPENGKIGLNTHGGAAPEDNSPKPLLGALP